MVLVCFIIILSNSDTLKYDLIKFWVHLCNLYRFVCTAVRDHVHHLWDSISADFDGGFESGIQSIMQNSFMTKTEVVAPYPKKNICTSKIGPSARDAGEAVVDLNDENVDVEGIAKFLLCFKKMGRRKVNRQCKIKFKV